MANSTQMEQFNMRLSPQEVKLLDAEVARRAAETGFRLTRQDVVRALILKALRPAGAPR